jgi:hypothetical protein
MRSRSAIRTFHSVLAAALVCVSACMERPDETEESFERPAGAAKVMLIGLDGADWKLISGVI